MYLVKKPSLIKGTFVLDNNQIAAINEKYDNDENNTYGIYKLPTEFGSLYYNISVKDEKGTMYYDLAYMDNKNNLQPLSTDLFFDRATDECLRIINDYSESLNDDAINFLKGLTTCTNEEELIDNYKKITIELDDEIKQEFTLLIKELKKNKWIDILPKYKFIYFNSFIDVLNDQLSISEIDNSIQAQNVLQIGSINIEELKEACENNEQEELDYIENTYIDVVTKKFKKIFKQVDPNFKLKIRVDTTEKRILFLTHDKTSPKKSLSISQRSDGFRWYLSIYLTLYEYIEKSTDYNYVLLIDEPNLYLHATAQKDLLDRIFKEEFKDIQILYTTHSPYMIDGDNLFTIRIIEKDEQTIIYNTPQDYIKSSETNVEVDTITPLLTSLELCVSTNMTFGSNDRILLVEGVQDVYILKAFIKVNKLEKAFEKIKIIGCYGAAKLQYMYSYLVGMGYETYVLVDDDKAGRDTLDELAMSELDSEKLFIKYSKKGNKIKNCILESMFSEKDSELYFPKKSTILSKRIFDNWDSYNFNAETRNNFKLMLDLILKMINQNYVNDNNEDNIKEMLKLEGVKID